MKLKFKYGFNYKDFLYGWLKKELYRLPSTSGNKSYGLKRLSLIKVGVGEGYRLKKDKLSVLQCKNMAVEINKVITVINDTIDLPE